MNIAINKRWNVELTDTLNGFRAVRREAALASASGRTAHTIEQEMVMKIPAARADGRQRSNPRIQAALRGKPHQDLARVAEVRLVRRREHLRAAMSLLPALVAESPTRIAAGIAE